MRQISPLALLISGLLLPFYTMAQNFEQADFNMEDFYGDEDFVSIATGTKKPIHRAPSVASVITSDDIEMMGANTIHQVLETVTGIHTYPSNVNRMNPSYSIRGIHTSENPQVLVLVNGIKTTYEFTGAKWNIFDVGINLIDRIEVIRGPGSAVYGADAYSGVINIITKGNNALFNNEVGVKTGSFGTQSTWFNFATTVEDLKLSINAQWQNTEGDDNRRVSQDRLYLLGQSDISNAPGSLDTRHEYTDFHAQLDYKAFYAHFWHLNLSGGTGAGAAQALSKHDKTSGKQSSIKSGFHSQINDDLKIDFSLQYQSYNSYTFFEIFPAGYVDEAGVTYTQGYLGSPRVEDTTYKTTLSTNYSGLKNHNLRFEIGYQHTKETTDEFKNFGPNIITADEFKNFGPNIITADQTSQDGTLTSVKGTSAIFVGDNSRQLYYLTIQDEWSIANDWELTAGIRYDDYSDFGSTINPRLALVWQTQHTLTSKLLYGSAYRAPSFGDLYASNNPVQLGNPNLSPEKIDTIELAFDYRLQLDWTVLFNIYAYKSTDLVDYVGNQLENSLEQDGVGSELELHWKPANRFHIKLGYAWQQAEDSNGDKIADAPSSSLDANFTWKITHDFSIYSDSYWIMNRKRSSDDSRAALDNYIWTNLNLKYQINAMSLNLSIRNVFNVKAKEASNGQIADDYPLESRGVWVNASYQF